MINIPVSLGGFVNIPALSGGFINIMQVYFACGQSSYQAGSPPPARSEPAMRARIVTEP